MDIKFSDLCILFETLSTTTRTANKLDRFRNFIDDYKQKARAVNGTDTKFNFYPVLRLILPQLDRDRGSYGVKEYKFARMIINMLCIPPRSQEALQLTNFRASSALKVRDLADAAYWILRKHFNVCNMSNITVEEVNNHLDAIAQKNANNEPSKCTFRLLLLSSMNLKSHH